MGGVLNKYIKPEMEIIELKNETIVTSGCPNVQCMQNASCPGADCIMYTPGYDDWFG
jgi:hypothetical protein